MSAPLDNITSVFQDLAKSLDFAVVKAGAERHGAFEWSASRREGSGLIRVLTVAVASELGTDPTGPCTVEFWMGVDDGAAFGRHLEWRRRLHDWIAVPDLIESHWEGFVKDAEALGSSDLTTRYVVPEATW